MPPRIAKPRAEAHEPDDCLLVVDDLMVFNSCGAKVRLANGSRVYVVNEATYSDANSAHGGIGEYRYTVKTDAGEQYHGVPDSSLLKWDSVHGNGGTNK